MDMGIVLGLALLTPVWSLGDTILYTIRDFQDTHSDFESFNCGSVVTGIVESRLGVDDKPVYNGGDGTCTTTAANFDQWFNTVDNVNMEAQLPLDFEDLGNNSFTFSDPAFFPIDDNLLGNQGRDHNYLWTIEFGSTFTYERGQVFDWCGDDDVWIFVEYNLALDLGGTHQGACGSINMDDLGLTDGASIHFRFFLAHRQSADTPSFTATTYNIYLHAECQVSSVAGVSSDCLLSRHVDHNTDCVWEALDGYTCDLAASRCVDGVLTYPTCTADGKGSGGGSSLTTDADSAEVDLTPDDTVTDTALWAIVGSSLFLFLLWVFWPLLTGGRAAPDADLPENLHPLQTGLIQFYFIMASLRPEHKAIKTMDRMEENAEAEEVTNSTTDIPLQEGKEKNHS